MDINTSKNFDGLLASITSFNDSPLEQIESIQWAMLTLQADLETAVRGARLGGESWATIGKALGMTRQAAHERFHDESLHFDHRAAQAEAIADLLNGHEA